MPKITWTGRLLSMQPAVRLTRSFDQREQTYLGYVLSLHGTVGDDTREFQNEKHRFQVSDHLSGESEPVPDPDLEPAELSRTTKIVFLERKALACVHAPPPGTGFPRDSRSTRSAGSGDSRKPRSRSSAPRASGAPAWPSK